MTEKSDMYAPYDEANVFAKIIRGELPSARCYEDDVVIGLMDLFPQSRGHTLVIPKQEKVINFFDLVPEKIGPFMQRVHKIAHMVRKAFDPDGVLIGQMNGSQAGQTVFHLHFHIIPRYKDVGLKGHGKASQADPAQLQELAQQIAAQG